MLQLAIRSRWLVPLILIALPAFAIADSIPLTDLGVSKVQQDWGKPQIDLSVGSQPLRIGGQTYQHGLGTHASSRLWLDLNGAAERFTANVGVDDETKSSPRAVEFPILFQIIGDGKVLFDSGKMKVGDTAKAVDVDLHGIKSLLLLAMPAGNGVDFCHADWADAMLTFNGQRPVTLDAPRENAEILTPKSGPAPRINSAKVFGVRPGHPVLYTIAATGDRPMTFAAEGLPQGLSLDAATGQITGSVAQVGDSVVHLKAVSAAGHSERDLKIKAGDTINLTPQMGWNSWNCFATAVSDEKVRAAADAMISSGLINHGWTYINIDDCYEVRANEPPDHRREADGTIKTNKKFPDMKALADYIHTKGMRAGLYSSPGFSTCGNYTASYQFEEKDAQTYAKWGFDYLKYDWCSYDGIAHKIKPNFNQSRDIEMDQHPYAVMRDALLKQDRDIVFSFCQYGMGDVWKWGKELGGNSWRTTGDITDTWGSMAGIGFHQSEHAPYAGPGHWNDPDMLVVGKVGWGPALHPTRLTPNEQYTHITLWCLLDSPLLIGCDMTQMDDFTLGLLTNDDVIAVNQDPLGKQASRVAKDGELEVWAKEMEDGSKAIGLFNRGEIPATVTVKWSDLGITGKQSVRDLWREKDLGDMDNQYSVEIARHGAAMIQVHPARQ